ncbi:MAG: DNA helicase II / ATP-dependent DNA helicase PcrA [Parcubacteria group bacterium Greene0714_4]|nr:MAG: DNA helicase II / ATP-dependent DNA helicase PcrA [Parcubacteria group bacterium Greene0714_4]
MTHYLDALNPQQREAVLHTEGPLLIVAGAGAGKTKTLSFRILHLIEQGVAPEEILAITFTNKAAKEMRDRIRTILQKNRQENRSWHERPFVSTFHALGVHIIKENAAELGYTKNFSIFDRSDSIRAVKDALASLGLDPKQHEPAKILSKISREKGMNKARQKAMVAKSLPKFGKNTRRRSKKRALLILMIYYSKQPICLKTMPLFGKNIKIHGPIYT